MIYLSFFLFFSRFVSVICGVYYVLQPAETKTKKAKEAASFSLSNPCRLIPAQVRFLSLPAEGRYTPVRTRGNPMGILVLRDSEPSQPETVSKGALMETMAVCCC